jgi:APA family basic amino acid/polyamine antiporter
MSRDRNLPGSLAYVHPRFGVPVHAELAVCIVVVTLVLSVDLHGAIGFSSFGVLLYYAIANVSAATLRTDQRRPPRALCALGAVGCVVLAGNLPFAAIAAGTGVTAVGWLGYLAASRRRKPSHR